MVAARPRRDRFNPIMPRERKSPTCLFPSRPVPDELRPERRAVPLVAPEHAGREAVPRHARPAAALRVGPEAGPHVPEVALKHGRPEPVPHAGPEVRSRALRDARQVAVRRRVVRKERQEAGALCAQPLVQVSPRRGRIVPSEPRLTLQTGWGAMWRRPPGDRRCGSPRRSEVWPPP